MIIDHIGIVVKSIDKGMKHWKKVFKYEQLTGVVTNSRQKVKVVFLIKENSLKVKLIMPIDNSSTVYRFAMKGGGLHHLCFKCENLEDEILRLKQLGLRILADPQPGEAFDNDNIAFVYAQFGLNIELIDTNKLAELIT